MGPQAAARARLRLVPAGPRGWFGGRSIEATGPVDVVANVSLEAAASALQATFDGAAPEAALTAVLARYDGSCTVVRFSQAQDVAALSAPAPPAAPPAAANRAHVRGPLLSSASWDITGQDYRRAVRATRERIAAGDVYVLNLTARLSGVLVSSHAEDAFETLVERASADMAACLTGLPGATPWIASVSPERFVRVISGEHGARIAEISPIKGTAPRGASVSADRDYAAALARDPKERAEHIMVVDLERNDLGTCCVPGTVHVDPLYEVVPTPYCHQLVSTVRGTLRPQTTFAELLTAAFPCGSVTGAPKRAAMRIIGELEISERGAYCGALLVAMRGELDSSVLIRTLEGDEANERRASWGAGCGITHDSDPAAEHLEMLLKASPALGDTPPPVALRETMRVVHRRVPLLDRHLARLVAGGAGPSALAAVRAAVAEQLAMPDAAGAYARLGVTVTPDGEVSATITTQHSSLDVAGGPVIVPVKVDAVPTLPPQGAKPAARRWWDRAHEQAELLGGHQALLVAPDGTLIDGSTATVWLLHGDTLSSPPSPAAVAGVMREVIFDLAPAHGLRVHERSLTLDDYHRADEVWLSNAVGGFVRARKG